MAIDRRFEKASTSFLDEGVLMKQFEEQIQAEERVQGTPWFPVKPTDFEQKWRKMKSAKDHSGVAISKSGHLMTEEWLQRARQFKQLQQNALSKKLRAIRAN